MRKQSSWYLPRAFATALWHLWYKRALCTPPERNVNTKPAISPWIYSGVMLPRYPSMMVAKACGSELISDLTKADPRRSHLYLKLLKTARHTGKTRPLFKKITAIKCLLVMSS